MIGCLPPSERTVVTTSPGSNPGPPTVAREGSGVPADGSSREPVLCLHCGRTASNGIGCQGICVADSGY